MAAILTGTPVAVAWGLSQNPTGQNITIPSDATAVYMFWGWDGINTAGHGLASATLNSVAPDQSIEVTTDTNYEFAGGVSVWYNPATGSQTLDVAWDAAPVEGPICIVAFVKDGDTTAWRDADAARTVSTANSVTLTTTSGDLVIKFDARYSGSPDQAPALTSGWTNGQTQVNQSNEHARLSYISATGSTQVCASETTDYPLIVAVAIPASGGPAATVDQQAARFGADDGSESAHTWLAAQNGNVTHPLASAFLARFLLQATGDFASSAFTLRAQKNGAGGYVAVPVGSGTAEAYSLPTWGAVGTAASGTTSCTPAYPAGISAATSKLFCVVTGRSNTENTVPTMPAGWTRIGGLEGGTGTWGVDTGTRRVDIFQKDTTVGDETGTVTVSLAGTTANTLRASIHRIEVASGYGIDVELVTGADTSNDTSYSAAASANATFDSNRLVLIATAQNLDTGTATSRAISASGITFATLTNRADTAVTNGNDHRHIVNTVPVSSGSGTVAPTYSYTVSANASGPTAFLVLRGRLPAVTNELYIAPSSNIAAGGEATTNRLTGGTDTFVTGRRWDDENGTDTIDLTLDDFTEVEWSLNTQSPAANGDYWDFRVYAGATALTNYDVTPRLTLGAAGGVVLEGGAAGRASATGDLTVRGFPVGLRAFEAVEDPDLPFAFSPEPPRSAPYSPLWMGSGGPASHALSGAAIAAASVAAALSIGKQPSAAAVAQALVAGQLDVLSTMTAASLSLSVVNGNLAVAIPLAGASVSTAVVAGPAAVVKPLAGAAAAQAAVAGQPGVQVPLAAAVAALASVGGGVAIGKPLAGISASVALGAGDLTVTPQGSVDLAGGAGAQSDVRGALQIAVHLSAQSLSQALAAANLSTSGSVDLSGAVLGRAASAGSLSLSLSIAGQVAGRTVGGGALQVQAASLTAESLSQAAAAGGLTLTLTFSAQALSQALVAGVLGSAIDGAVPLVRIARAARAWRASRPARAYRVAA